MIRRIKNRKFEKKSLRRKFESKIADSLYDSSMLEEILDSIISLSKEVVKKYGEKVADYIGFQHGFGAEGSGFETAKPLFRWNISCLELSKFNSLKDIDLSSVEKGWSEAIENHIEFMKDYSEDDGEDLVLTMWLRFQDIVHPLNEMTLEYAFPVEFYSFDDYSCLEPELIDGDEDILEISSLEQSELNDIAEGVRAYLDQKKESILMRRKNRSFKLENRFALKNKRRYL